MILLTYLNIIFSFSVVNVDVPDFVEDYHNLSSKKEELNYIKKYEESKNNDIKAYVISLKMKQAKYKIFPWSKLVAFNKEKKVLNQLIKANPKNVHLRYVRLVIQENAPKILAFNKYIKSDKLVLISILKIKDKTDYLDEYILKNTSL